MSEQRITRERVGAVTVITLNRPEAYNALDLQLGEELLDALIECDEDRGVRAVVLTGAGRAFCAGGDIRAVDASGSAGGAAAFLFQPYTHGRPGPGSGPRRRSVSGKLSCVSE